MAEETVAMEVEEIKQEHEVRQQWGCTRKVGNCVLHALVVSFSLSCSSLAGTSVCGEDRSGYLSKRCSFLCHVRLVIWSSDVPGGDWFLPDHPAWQECRKWP